MKKTLLALALVTTSLTASAEHTLAVGAGITQQKLFDTIKFNMPTAHINYNYWVNDYLGLYVDVGRTTETANDLYIEGKEYTNKITFMSSFGVAVRYPITDRLNVIASLGQTDYKSIWTVNGKRPSWYKGTDSDKSYHLGLSYSYNSKGYIALTASRLYTKHKIGFGEETTDSLVLYTGYRF